MKISGNEMSFINHSVVLAQKFAQYWLLARIHSISYTYLRKLIVTMWSRLAFCFIDPSSSIHDMRMSVIPLGQPFVRNHATASFLHNSLTCFLPYLANPILCLGNDGPRARRRNVDQIIWSHASFLFLGNDCPRAKALLGTVLRAKQPRMSRISPMWKILTRTQAPILAYS